MTTSVSTIACRCQHSTYLKHFLSSTDLRSFIHTRATNDPRKLIAARYNKVQERLENDGIPFQLTFSMDHASHLVDHQWAMSSTGAGSLSYPEVWY